MQKLLSRKAQHCFHDKPRQTELGVSPLKLLDSRARDICKLCPARTEVKAVGPKFTTCVGNLSVSAFTTICKVSCNSPQALLALGLHKGKASFLHDHSFFLSCPAHSKIALQAMHLKG